MKTRALVWLLLGSVWLAAVGCGDDNESPMAPTPATPSFAGTWAGASQFQQCTGNPAACTQAVPGSTAPTEFILTQTGTAVSGTWTVNAAEPRIAVSGSVAADGSLNLTGRLPASQAVLDSTRLTVAGTSMSGTLTYTVTFPNTTQSPVTITIALQSVTRR